MHRGFHVASVLLLASTTWAATKVVHVGQGGLKFVDEETQTSTTTVDPGDTVEWVWEGAFPHSTTRGTAPETWDSGIVRAPFTFSRPFSIDGTFDYVCTPHRTLGMTGTVVVRTPTTSDGKLAVFGGRMTALQLEIDAAIAGKSKKAFDNLLNKAATNTQDARTQVASGQSAQAKTLLKRAIRSLITLRFRLGSNTGRSRIKDATLRTKLIAEAKQIKTDVQSLLKSL